jgi:hypothetical protein
MEAALVTMLNLCGGGGHQADAPAAFIFAAYPLVHEGQQFSMPSKLHEELFVGVRQYTLPQQRRATTKGIGTCFGATYERSVARLGHFTRKCGTLVRQINAAAAAALGNHQFHWGSIQVNVDTFSTVHRDSNNVGLSIMVLLVKLKGGTFHMHDESLTLNTPETAKSSTD